MNEIIIEAGSFEFLIIGTDRRGLNCLLLKSSAAKLDLLGYAKNAFQHVDNNNRSTLHELSQYSEREYNVCWSDFVSINSEEREHKLLLAYKINRNNVFKDYFLSSILHEFKAISSELNFAISKFNELDWLLDTNNKEEVSKIYKKMDANKIYDIWFKRIEWYLSTIILIGKVIDEKDEYQNSINRRNS